MQDWTSDTFRHVQMCLMGRLYKNYSRSCKRLGWSHAYIQDWLEDISVGALELAIKDIEKWEPARGDFHLWVFLKGRMLARDSLRKNENAQGLEDDIKTIQPTYADPIDEQIATRAEIESLLAEMTPDQAEAISLYYWQGLQVREIARIMRCAEKTVYTLLDRGRKKALAYFDQVEAAEEQLSQTTKNATSPSQLDKRESPEVRGQIESRPPPDEDRREQSG